MENCQCCRMKSRKKEKWKMAKLKKDIINKIESPDPVIDGNLQVTGYVKAQAFFQFSDLRLKTSVEDLVGALDIISNLKGKSYQWKADQLDMENDGVSDKKVSRTIGLIAQEVQLVIPEVVKVDPETGLLSVSYVELIPVIIEALKEFMRNIENSNQMLSRDMQDLNTRLQKLEKENPESNAKTSKYIQLYRDTLSPSVHMPLGSLIFAFLLLMVGTILLIIYLQQVSTYNEASSILHQKSTITKTKSNAATTVSADSDIESPNSSYLIVSILCYGIGILISIICTLILRTRWKTRGALCL